MASTQDYLPSRRVVGLAVILFGLLGVVILLQHIDSSQKKGDVAVVASEVRGIDSDADGLADWEEDLWATDPHNLDTDGDGTSDGEEVRNNRHPKVAGPDDAISQSHKDLVYLDTQHEPISGKKIIEDTIIPRAFLAAGKRVTGYEVTDQEIDSIFSPLINEAQKDISFYTQDDLNVSAQTSQTDYYKQLIQTAVDAASKEVEYEAPGTLLARLYADEQPDSEILSSLDGLRGIYTSLRDTLLSAPVPPSFAQDHLKLVNAYSAIIYGLQQAQKAPEDPASAVIGFEQYNDGYNRAQEAFYTISSTVREQLE